MPFLAQAGLVPRRRKVANACDFCREHRVRCEAATPCPACVANNVPCVRSRPSHTPRRRNRVQRSDKSARQQGECHLTDDRQIVEDASTSTSASTSPPPPIPTPSSRLEWTSHKTDSILGFIARINAFCSKVPQQCPDTAPSSDPSLDQPVPFLSGISHGTQVCDLSPAQIDRIMQIFWSRLRPLMPIVQWNEITPSSEHSSTPFQPLKDAITVYTLHYISSSGLHTRLVGLNWPQFQPQQRNHLQSPTLGLAYFQRALSAVTQLSTFARPSLPVMQCYCYLTLYLLDSGQHQAAYVMVGLGLRIAHSLNYMDSRNGWYRECALFRHVWWTLVHLEFRCARHVGKPVTSCVDGLVGLGPSNKDLQDVERSSTSGLAYHVESIRLTAAALAVHRAMDRRGMAETTDIETRAEILSECLDTLKRWRDELPRHEPFTNLHLDIDIFDTIDTDGAPPLGSSDERNTRGDHTELQLALELDQPPVLTLQNTFLSLQYHNTMMTLHRIFIQFPSASASPSPSPSRNTSTSTPCPTSTSTITSKPTSTDHAKTALAHASAILTLTHARLSMHETHHGHAEIYQYAWNAVITIIGFVLANPYLYPYPICAALSSSSSSRCRPSARAYLNLDLALEVFASAREGSAARRAATLTRGLWGRVEGLVAGFQGQVQARARAPAGQGFTTPGGYSAGSGSGEGGGGAGGGGGGGREGVEIRGLGKESGFGVRDAAAPTSTAAAGTSTTTTTTLPCADGQLLWSWDDLSNLEAWPSYGDEVYEAFMVDPDPEAGPADIHAPQALL